MGLPLSWSEQSKEDYFAASHWYFMNAGPKVAEQFVQAVEAATQAIRDQPGIGTTRISALAGGSGFRSISTPQFPYLIFYVPAPGGLKIVRILHERQDIPVHLQEVSTSIARSST